MLTKTLRTLTVAVALAFGAPFLASAAGPNGISPAYGTPCYGGPGAYGQANGPNCGPVRSRSGRCHGHLRIDPQVTEGPCPHLPEDRGCHHAS